MRSLCACGCGERIEYKGFNLTPAPSELRRRSRCRFLPGHYGKVRGELTRRYRSRKEYVKESRAVLDKLDRVELRPVDPSRRSSAKVFHTPFGAVVCDSQSYLATLKARVRAKLECGDANGLPCDVCRKFCPRTELVVYERKTRPGTIAFHRECKAFKDAERKRQMTAQRRYNRVWKAVAFREGR